MHCLDTLFNRTSLVFFVFGKTVACVQSQTPKEVWDCTQASKTAASFTTNIWSFGCRAMNGEAILVLSESD